MNFLTPYKNAIIGGAFVLLLLFCALQSYRLNSCEAKIAKSTAQISILANDLETINIATQKLSEDSDKRTLEAQEAIKKANSANGINQTKIARLKSQLGKFTDCNSAIDYSKGLL